MTESSKLSEQLNACKSCVSNYYDVLKDTVDHSDHRYAEAVAYLNMVDLLLNELDALDEEIKML